MVDPRLIGVDNDLNERNLSRGRGENNEKIISSTFYDEFSFQQVSKNLGRR